ncbi:hypothetical protein [Schlesneria paludicola]|uniref:hypothetical protein n=1 Tax=Schlesneria paludicola TaxID=360056 RepID=UPI00029B1820|nr:hypothetical protein [Schlesneria paludicola]
MTSIKLFFSVVCLSLVCTGSAFAQPGWGHHHRHYYGYGRPVYGYPPVVVAPPPVVVAPPPAVIPAPAPGVVYSSPVYPGPTYVAPAPVPVYAPPAYGYGVVGPRGRYGFGYSSPGVGVYIGR